MKKSIFYQQKLFLAIAISTALVGFASSVHAETYGNTPSMQGQPKNEGGVRKSPTFMEADQSGDHYVTKAELKDYPYLLKYFDKVDAGEDGRLELNEYKNLVMEKEREKGR